MNEKRRSDVSFVFVLEDRGWNVGLHLVRRGRKKKKTRTRRCFTKRAFWWQKKAGHVGIKTKKRYQGRARLEEQRSWQRLLLISGRWQQPGGCLSARRCCRARMLFVHVGVSGPVFAVLTLHCPRHGSGVSAESPAPVGV